MTLHAAILAGGSGTRFWPASRAHRPKQLLPLCAGRSLLENTVLRVQGLVGLDHVWIITNPDQAPAIREALPTFPADQVLVEPEPRDTAPCVAMATAVIEARDPGAVVAAMPADHLIEPEDEFRSLLQEGSRLATGTDCLVTFGIPPTRPATGFGYIETAGPLDDGQFPHALRVAGFREKPDRRTAEEFLRDGRYLWNSGIFLWRCDSLLRAMDAASPVLAGCTRKMLAAARANDPVLLVEQFRKAPRDSIDFAVMEKAPDIVVLQADLQWNDLGSFLALGALGRTDPEGNVLVTAGGDAVIEDSRDCVVYGEGPQTITLFGVRDLVVVAVEDAILVCPKDRAEDLKDVVRKLRDNGRDDLL